MKIRINFERLDRGNVSFRSAAERMAKFIYDHQEYFYHLAYVVRVSKNWTFNNYQEELTKYTNPLKPTMTASAHNEKLEQEYIYTLTNLYGLCKKDADIHILRGILVEYVFSTTCKAQSNRDWTLEVGCAVKINGRTVEYKCNEIDESKKTVDLGAWNFFKQSGIFAEVKVSPDVFGDKDCGFLQCLRNILRFHDLVRYKIYVFSLKQKNLMKAKIESLGYPLDIDTIILAPDNLFTENFFDF